MSQKKSQLSGGGDPEAIKSLICLGTTKQELTEKLAKLKDKNKELRENVDRKKRRVSDQSEAHIRMKNRIDSLKDQSLSGKQSIEKLKSNLLEKEVFAQQLSSKADQREDQISIATDDIKSKMDSLSQQFLKLSLNSNCKQICDQKSAKKTEQRDQSKDQMEALVKQIKGMAAKKESLIEELSQRNNGSDLLSDDSSQEFETGLDIKWIDWPIRDRMKALQIFSDENELLIQDIELLNRMEKEEQEEEEVKEVEEVEEDNKTHIN